METGQYVYVEFSSASRYKKMRNKSGMTKIMQTGRSMLEMLGVLAIIGVLVSIAIWGIKYALDKNIANDVLNDVEICQLQLKERDEIISEMREISFSKKTDYDYYGQDVLASGEITSVVLVKTISKGVCKRLQDMDGIKGLRIYEKKDEQSYGKFTECNDENEMYFAYANEGEILQCSKECPYNEHCTLSDECVCEENFIRSGVNCIFCGPQAPQEITNEDCCVHLGYEWNVGMCSCPSGTYYNGTMCTPAEGFCLYKYQEPAKPNFDTVKYAQCSMNFTEPAPYEKVKYAQCSMNFTEPTQYTKNYQATCSYTYQEPGIISPSVACDAGQYCVLKWTDEVCSGTIGASGQSTIYGRCVDLKTAPPAECRAVVSNDNAPVLTPGTPCNEGQYCALKWTDNVCSGTIGASGQPTIYGRCVDLKTSPPAKCRAVVENEKRAVLTPEKGCEDDQYCYLQWTDESCTAMEATGASYLYGVCLGMKKNSPKNCPI